METVTSPDGTRIAYDRAGDGPAVILVGGAFSYRAFGKLRQLADLLAPRFTVVNYDRRGRGDSGDGAPYAVEREIEDLAALIDAAGGSASVWGWCSGGTLALRAAAAGLPIERLAVYEPPFLVDGDRFPPPDLGARLAELVRAGERGRAVRYFMTQAMGVPGPIVTMMRLTPFWPKLKATAHTLPYDWAVMGDTMSGRPLDAAEWSRVTTPTVVLAGEKTEDQLRSGARAIAEVLPHGELRVLERQSHNVAMKRLAPVLEEHFRTPALAYR
jgi:pimeloyl-ACP methyl ester carboxylesterase